jgi:HEPN domain-containing protein
MVPPVSASARQIQPDAIFNHADTFFHALNQLHQSPPGNIHSVIMPVMVISAFASELYFKTLVALEGNKPAWGHDLNDLFLRLSPIMQGHLKNRWDPIARDREEINKNLDRKERVPIPRSLPDAIEEGREGFERLRYIYEGGDPFRFILKRLARSAPSHNFGFAAVMGTTG